MEIKIDLNSLIFAIDNALNFALLLSCIAYSYYFRLDLKLIWKTRNFSSNEALTSMTAAVLVNLIWAFIYSFVITSIFSLGLPKEPQACLNYTVQSLLLLAYVSSHVVVHKMLDINMHSLSKLCCLFGNILIYINLIRFADRLIFETNLLSWAYRISVFSINSIMVLVMIGSLAYLVTTTHKLNRKEA